MKYENAAAEYIANQTPFDQTGSVSEGTGWHGLWYLEDTDRARYPRYFKGVEAVIMNEDEQGFTSMRTFRTVEEAEEEWAKLTAYMCQFDEMEEYQ